MRLKCRITDKDLHDAMKNAAELFHSCGIHEGITIKLKPNDAGWKCLRNGKAPLACYRGLTQFKAPYPIIWINKDAEDYPEIYKCSTKKEAIVDDILHEYGHIIAEWGRIRNPKITKIIQGFPPTPEELYKGEEEFSEGLVQYIKDGCESGEIHYNEYRHYRDAINLYKKDLKM